MVSLCWLHQDWFVWPMLEEFNEQDNFLSWLYVQEHELKMGIPAGMGFQIVLSFAIAAVWWLAVWKAWPTELEDWAEGSGQSRRRSRGGRRGGGNDQRGGGDSRDRRDEKKSSGQRSDDGGSRRRRSRGGRGRRSSNRGGESS